MPSAHACAKSFIIHLATLKSFFILGLERQWNRRADGMSEPLRIGVLLVVFPAFGITSMKKIPNAEKIPNAWE